MSIISNWCGCAKCHAGYGWKDANFDFTNIENIDCVVCHDGSQIYKKGLRGIPKPDINLKLVAQKVQRPDRKNCGSCHFYGGGNDAVRHANMGSSLIKPSKDFDFHMGELDFRCYDCHQVRFHKIAGSMITTPVREGPNEGRVECETCHTKEPHVTNLLLDNHLNRHTTSIACQTCHIPRYATVQPTVIYWDWSQAGQNRPVEKNKYGKISYHKKHGRQVWAKDLRPTYAWYNGKIKRYFLGDPIDLEKENPLALPVGDISDPNSKIWPFKIHRGKQPADKKNKYLAVPHLIGPDGFWKTFDWNKTIELGLKAAGLPYSGEYTFVKTSIYFGVSHGVVPAKKALSCADCHTKISCSKCHKVPKGIDEKKILTRHYFVKGAPPNTPYLDFKALGYKGDPIDVGSRFTKIPIIKKE